MRPARAAIFFGLILLSPFLSASRATSIDARLFGLHVLYNDKPYPDGERTSWPSVKFGSWRVWNSFVSWHDLQSTPDNWDFSRLDRYVSWAEKAKVEVVYTLGRTPNWAVSRPNERCIGNYICLAEPPDYKHWENYVRALARRYKGRIAAYEIWNEPAFSEVDPLYRADGRPIQYFAGSAKQMVEMAKLAYLAIKSEDPHALVVSPGVTSEGNGLRRLEAYLAAGGGQWADAIAFHFYVSPPEEAFWQISRLKELLAKFGQDGKPIWNTEMGYVYAKEEFGVVEGPKTGRWTDVLDQHTGAAYLARSLILMAATGVRRVHWFNWDGDPPHPTMGIAAKRGRGTTPMATAFSKIQTWLVGSTDLSCKRNAEEVWVCAMRINEKRQWIAWSAGQDARLNLADLNSGEFHIDKLMGVEATQVSSTLPLLLGAMPTMIRQK